MSTFGILRKYSSSKKGKVMDKQSVYLLDFVSKSKQRGPEIVVSINQDHVEDVFDVLAVQRKELEESKRIVSYLKRQRRVVFKVDRYGKIGYGSCCIVREEHGQTDLCFRLERRKRLEIAATLQAILDVLNPFVLAEFDHGVQQVELATNTEARFHGHSVSGHGSAKLRSWLLGEASKPDSTAQRTVTNAMQEAWACIADHTHIRYANEVGARIVEDGRFLLGCFGNACDLSVYPEGVIGDDHPFEFSSHNLDMPSQQLTLIAGLAQLCALARA